MGFGTPRLEMGDGAEIERVIVQRPLQRVLAFLGCSIDDVCNDPIARNQVIGYYKLHRHVLRVCEATELERQWNPIGATG